MHDLNHGKRRLFFSTAHKETQTTPLHNKIPLNYIKRDIVSNDITITICIDLEEDSSLGMVEI